jgi:hypothetical protein
VTDPDDTPRARLLHARRECDLGIASAEACLQDEWLKPFQAAYHNRIAYWLTTRDAVDRAIAALPEDGGNAST